MTDDAIATMLDAWTDAERSGDADRLGELLTDDFVGVGPVGFALPRDAWLARLGPDLRYDRLDLDEDSVRTHGDTTIVLAHQHAAGEAQGGNPVPPDTRVSFVVVPDGDRPRIAGMQYSFLVPVP
jgi:ketosteroid isomerase-like protein